MRPYSILLSGLLAQQIYAHGGVSNYTVGDTWYDGYDPYGPTTQDNATTIVQRKWITNYPIASATNTSLACNFPGTPAASSIPIAAGQNISAIYYYWLHPVGPMIAWLTRCPGTCHDYIPTNASWFKIGQKGLQGGTVENGDWFQKTFSNWDGGPSIWSENVPRSLRPGHYLVRHEIISIHIANKPQWYPECAHLVVEGDGDAFPGDEYMAKIPGVWNMSQPEINIDIYSPEWANRTTYNIPGPPVWYG